MENDLVEQTAHLMSAEREKSGVEGVRIKHSLPGHTPHPVTYLLRLDPS